MTVRIYHNPRCSKSRATLALLEERGVVPDVVRYLDEPPSPETLRELLRLLDIPARELLRKGETEYRDLGLADESLDDEALIRAMASHPRLIERPIVTANGRAAIGRPPESVLAIL